MVCVACGRRRQHRCMGKLGYTPLSPAMDWHFHVSISFSSIFVRWLFGRHSWKSTLFAPKKLLRALGHSSSI